MENLFLQVNVCYHPKETTTATKHVWLLISEKKTWNLSHNSTDTGQIQTEAKNLLS
jgi:hypothetical protein